MLKDLTNNEILLILLAIGIVYYTHTKKDSIIEGMLRAMNRHQTAGRVARLSQHQESQRMSALARGPAPWSR